MVPMPTLSRVKDSEMYLMAPPAYQVSDHGTENPEKDEAPDEVLALAWVSTQISRRCQDGPAQQEPGECKLDLPANKVLA